MYTGAYIFNRIIVPNINFLTNKGQQFILILLDSCRSWIVDNNKCWKMQKKKDLETETSESIVLVSAFRVTFDLVQWFEMYSIVKDLCKKHTCVIRVWSFLGTVAFCCCLGCWGDWNRGLWCCCRGDEWRCLGELYPYCAFHGIWFLYSCCCCCCCIMTGKVGLQPVCKKERERSKVDSLA